MPGPTDPRTPAPAGPSAPGHAPTAARLALVLLVVAAVAWLGFRAVRAFDVDRHEAEAAAVLAAPDTVTHQLPPVRDPVEIPVPGQGPDPIPPRQAAPRQAAPRQAAPPAPDARAPEREGSPPPEGASGAVHTPGSPGATGSPGAAGPGGQLSYRPGTWLTVVGLRGLEPVAGDERYLVFLRNWAGWTLAGAARPDAAGAAQVRSAAEPRPPTIYEVVVTRAVDDATSVPHGRPVLHWYEPSNAPPKARPFDFARGA